MIIALLTEKEINKLQHTYAYTPPPVVKQMTETAPKCELRKLPVVVYVTKFRG